jgi:S1-C subfamily serine protease
MTVSTTNGLFRLLFVIALLIVLGLTTSGQQSVSETPLAQPSVIHPQGSGLVRAPQIKSIAHRLDGIKVLNLLRRNGIKVAPLSDEMLMAYAVQMSITAGLSLSDGSIVARLPRAELEMSLLSLYDGPSRGIALPSGETPASIFVIEPNGKEESLRILGMDGGTGLSLLSPDNPRPATTTRDARLETLVLGQRVRLVFPASVPNTEGLSTGEVFVNVQELEGRLTRISRGNSGEITQIVVHAPQLSLSIVGGVAVNDAGETIGLVEASNGEDAQIIPVAAVRRAVERIRLGLEKKPRAWLGARGASIATLSIEQLEFVGWKRDEASDLIAKQPGVLLTEVPPETPASVANLRVGDVVTRINGGRVASAEEFSTLLTKANGNSPVRFTLLRPNRSGPQVVSVKLHMTLDPVLEMEAAEQRALRMTSPDPLVVRGIETLPITSELATRLKARGGIVVVFLHPGTAASVSGLRPGDVIESINGRLIANEALTGTLPDEITLNIVRNGQPITLQVLSSTKTLSRPLK